MSEKESKNIAKIYFIGVSKIVNNDLNQVYSDQDLSSLKQSIEEYGIKQPLSVVKQGESEYRLIAGHRRLAAVKLIFAEGKNVKFGNRELDSLVPCIFENIFSNEDDEYLNLISSNVSRNKTEDDMRRVIAKVADIYERRKDLPEYKGKKRDVIARLSGVSPRTVDKYLKEEAETVLKPTRIPPANLVVSMIGKMIDQVNAIDMEEYGRTDRNMIKESMSDLANLLKKKK